MHVRLKKLINAKWKVQQDDLTLNGYIVFKVPGKDTEFFR
jgi:hypothetical protein